MSNEKKMIGEPSPQAVEHARRLIALGWTKETRIDTIAGTWQAGYVAAQLDYSAQLNTKSVAVDLQERPSKEKLTKRAAEILETGIELKKSIPSLAERMYDFFNEYNLLGANVEKLKAFKEYVHQRLDGAGVEKEPKGKHSEYGCRIGDRMDIVLKEKEELKAKVEKLELLWSGAKEILKSAHEVNGGNDLGLCMSIELLLKKVGEKVSNPL
jgi:hypothetical protein